MAKSMMHTSTSTSIVLSLVPILIITLISLDTCANAKIFSSPTILRFKRSSAIRATTLSSSSSSIVQSLSSIRGGGGEDATIKPRRKKKKVSSKKKKKKTKSHQRSKFQSSSSAGVGAQVDDDDDDAVESSKSAIKNALKEDVATAMGDAIRARSSDLLQDDLTHNPIHHNDMTLNSISYAIGSSEQRQRQLLRNRHHRHHHHQQRLNASKQHQRQSSKQSLHDNNKKYSPMGIYSEGGGVEPSSSAVIANYFLKSHGGLHGIQSIMSILSVLFGIATFAIRIPMPSGTRAATNAATATSAAAATVSNPNSINRINLQIRLLQRTLICALSKHLSGLIAAATSSASRIPDIGWRGMNRNIKSFALDPVAQYLFYCAVLILWTNGVSLTTPILAAGSGKGASSTGTSTGAATMIVPWWLQDKRNLYCISCLIGPILIREMVSTIWVVADVLVLYSSSTTVPHGDSLLSDDQRNNDDDINNALSTRILSIGKSIIDAFMSILLTPDQWHNADPAQKQKQLAKLVARVSLLLEIGTGLILIIDAIRAFLDFSVSPVNSRPSWIGVAKRLICARLYINFMIVRRKKVVDLVSNLRGGFIVHRVLDLLDKPKDAMGLNWGVTEETNEGSDDKVKTPKSCKEWITFLLDF